MTVVSSTVYQIPGIPSSIELYASAYGDSGLTAQEVPEEIICDAMAGMNAFATEETERVAGEVGLFLRNVRKAAKDTGATKNTTGEGGVKHSRKAKTQYDFSKPFAEPVAVMTSQTQQGTSVVALLPIKTNAEQTIVPVVVDGHGRNNGIMIESNSLTSVFGKTNSVSKLLYDAVVDETSGKFSMLYWDKKEAITLLRQAGLQLPSASIPHDGFIHSLQEENSPVKRKIGDITETRQFKRWFGDWEKHPSSACKVVNADGTPKVVYHGTNKDFTVFQSASGDVLVLGDRGLRRGNGA